MHGWIPYITKLVSVNSHSWLFWNSNSYLPPWIQRTEWQLGLALRSLALRTCCWRANHHRCYWDPLLWHPSGAECRIFFKGQLWKNTSLSGPTQGRHSAYPSWVGKPAIFKTVTQAPPTQAQAAALVRSFAAQGKLDHRNAIQDTGMISMNTVTLTSVMGRAAFHLTPILSPYSQHTLMPLPPPFFLRCPLAFVLCSICFWCRNLRTSQKWYF